MAPQILSSHLYICIVDILILLLWFIILLKRPLEVMGVFHVTK